MTSFGHTFGFRNGWSHSISPLAGNAPPTSITPASAWKGTAGSGYTAVPTDPVRTTAKPAVRLLVPPRQRFSEEILVGVAAFANDGGTLIGGIDRVRVHFEGNTADILAPTLQTFTRRDGSDYRQLGYWAKLKRTGINGTGNLYFEAIPSDATMQSRVLGPFPFTMQPTQYTATVTVNPDSPVVTGVNYHDINTAANWCRTSGQSNPLIRVLKAGDYTLGTWNGYRPANFCTVEGVVPGVNIVNVGAGAYRPPDTYGCFTNEVWWRNVTFNFGNATHYRGAGGNTLGAVFEKCLFIDPVGRARTYAGSPFRPVSYLVAPNSWMLDCHFEGVHNPLAEVNLARGCTTLSTASDWTLNPRCIVNCIANDHDPRDARVDVNSLTVQYTGGEATATIAISGTRGGDGRVLTLKWGANTATLALESDQTSFTTAMAGGFDPVTANMAYWPSQVVTWINGKSGWTATLLDDTRAAVALGRIGTTTAAFPDTNAKAAALTLSTWFDYHSDIYQPTVATENVIFADSTVIGSANQNLFLSTSNGAFHFRDSIFVNLIITNKIEIDTNYAWNVAQSGCGFAHSHVVVAHVSMPHQAINMFTLATGLRWTPDAYCLVANNAFYRMNPGTGTQQAQEVAIRDNAIWGDQVDHPKASGTVIAGTADSWFPGFATGNLAPAGELLSNQKQVRLRFDATGSQRRDLSPVGALK